MQPNGCVRLAQVRILALYDIHGNVDALDAVLADPRAEHPDVVLVGGDAVPGPFARATLARLDALSVPCAGSAATASARWRRPSARRRRRTGRPRPVTAAITRGRAR